MSYTLLIDYLTLKMKILLTNVDILALICVIRFTLKLLKQQLQIFLLETFELALVNTKFVIDMKA